MSCTPFGYGPLHSVHVHVQRSNGLGFLVTVEELRVVGEE